MRTSRPQRRGLRDRICRSTAVPGTTRSAASSGTSARIDERTSYSRTGRAGNPFLWAHSARARSTSVERGIRVACERSLEPFEYCSVPFIRNDGSSRRRLRSDELSFRHDLLRVCLELQLSAGATVAVFAIDGRPAGWPGVCAESGSLGRSSGSRGYSRRNLAVILRDDARVPLSACRLGGWFGPAPNSQNRPATWSTPRWVKKFRSLADVVLGFDLGRDPRSILCMLSLHLICRRVASA